MKAFALVSGISSGIASGKQVSRWPYAVILICFAACFIRFPGEWDSDTIAQHAQMLTGEYLDWHPPVFAAFWGLVNQGWNAVTGMNYTGSGMLYVVHALMLWSGLALLVRAAGRFFQSFAGKPVWKLLAFSGFLLFFGLFEMVPMTRFIFKDTAMMAAYILALGIMLNMPVKPGLKLTAFLLCVILLFYGTAVRHNAVFALIPMLFLLLLKSWPGLRFFIAIPACLAIWLGILFGINFVSYDLLKAKQEHSLQEIIYVDFWKLNYKKKTFDVPPLPEGQSWGPLSEDVFFKFYNDKPLYIKSSFKFIRNYYGGEDSIALRYDFSQTPQAFDTLLAAWVDKVKRHFGTYVTLHKQIFMDLLREYSFMGFSGVVFLAAGLLIAGVGLSRCFRKNARRTDAAPYLVVISALLYVLPYMVAIPDIQRRYLFWFFFGCAFGIMWLATAFCLKYKPALTGARE